MKKKYSAPVVYVKAMDIESPIMANSSDKGLEQSGNGFTQTGLNPTTDVYGPDALAKPSFFWDEGDENQ